MKKVQIICVGKVKEPYFASGIAEYKKRLAKFCELNILELPDSSDAPTAVKTESAAIVKKLEETPGYKILLDIGGEQLTSPQLAQTLDAAYTNGHSTVTFVIGGSYGVSDEVRGLCNLRMSFGRVTFPHQLMRLLVCEQIYRAFTISSNMPYHK